MSSNTINNTGDGNYFNQNIGEQTINSMFSPADLASEYEHRESVRKNKRNTRIRRSWILIGVALVGLLACFGVLWSTGSLSSPEALVSFFRDLSVNAIVAIVGGIVAVAFSIAGGSGLANKSASEERQAEAQNAIRQRVEDLGVSRRDWVAHRKAARTGNRARE
nr:hypothetical protein [Pseudoclavibacter sp. Marseille-Q3772]